MLVKCIFNFSITNGSPDITFSLILINGATQNNVQSFTQSFSRNGHHSYPINFNYIMPNSLAFKITAQASAGDITTDTTDYYSVILDEVRPTE